MMLLFFILKSKDHKKLKNTYLSRSQKLPDIGGFELELMSKSERGAWWGPGTSFCQLGP